MGHQVLGDGDKRSSRRNGNNSRNRITEREEREEQAEKDSAVAKSANAGFSSFNILVNSKICFFKKVSELQQLE